MGDKSLQKKKFIVEKAKEVFCQQGFSSVTMKDIVEACEISRGGVYLYFSDTKEIFEAVLASEERPVIGTWTKDDALGDILYTYLDEQKKEILKKKDNLAMAGFEYSYANKKDSILKKQFQEDLKAMEKLISDGVAKKWMSCDNPAVAARNIMYTIEGMKVTSQTVGITADAIDKEIEFMLGTVGLTTA